MYPRVSCRQLLPCYRPSIGLAEENLGFPTGAQAYQQGNKLMLELHNVTKRTWKRHFCCCTTALWPTKRESWCTCTTFAGLGLDSRVERGCNQPWSQNLRRGGRLEAQTGTQLVTPTGVKGASLPYVTLSPPPSGHRAIWSHSEMCQTPAHILAEAKG